MAKFSSLFLTAVLAAVVAGSSSWKVADINLSVVAKDGIKKAEHKLVYPKAISSADAFAADPTDHLKLSFKVENSERPHQAMVRFQSKDEQADQIMVAASVKKASGKGRFELDFAKSDKKFKYGTRKYDMTLLVGGPQVEESLQYALGEIEVRGPSTNPPVRAARVQYQAQPEIHHQFRPDQKLINVAISGFFSLLVLSPVAVLIGLWSQLGIKFEPLKALAQNPVDLIMAVVFFASLTGIEYVFYSYWTHVTLFPVLQYLGVLSVVAIASGRSVLSAVQTRRLKRTEKSDDANKKEI
ncbi:proteasome regulatory particle base subunit [Podila clonocystis]|nr:proteasome regulatory particle base subunit [Podila clonocystis]